MLKLNWCIFIFSISIYFSQAEIQRDEIEETNLCENATVDAFIIFTDKTGYAFRGSYFWKVSLYNIENGPQNISKHWEGLPGNLDAAFTLNGDGIIIFFKGSKYWKFTDQKMDEGYPKYIEEGFPGVPNDIQAATVWGDHNFVYFFKGEYYWRYEPENVHPVKKTYPKLISDVFYGIPNNVDEAVRYPNGFLYFFKGIRYWKFNTDHFVAEMNRNNDYPRSTAISWFGCKSIA